MRRAYLCLAWIVLAMGCGHTRVPVALEDVEPRTYQPGLHALERGVGELRRLAILPLMLEVSPENEKYCFEGCDWDALRTGIARNIPLFLESRGYQVVELLTQSDRVEGNDGVAEEELRNASAKFAEAAIRSERDGGTELVELAQNLGVNAGVDGLVVVWGSASDMTKFDVGSWYATFSLSLPYTVLRTGVSLQCAVYEVRRGRLVWMVSHRSPSPMGNHKPFHTIVRGLLDPIEPALPAVMTEP